MISLSDMQLKTVMTAAGGLPPEKRDTFLRRIGDHFQRNGRRFTDADLDRAVRQALRGLVQVVV